MSTSSQQQPTFHPYMRLGELEMMNLLRYLYSQAMPVQKCTLVEMIAKERGGDEENHRRTLQGTLFSPASNKRNFQPILVRTAIDLIRSPDMFGEFHFNSMYDNFVDFELTSYRERTGTQPIPENRTRYMAQNPGTKRLQSTIDRTKSKAH